MCSCVRRLAVTSHGSSRPPCLPPASLQLTSNHQPTQSSPNHHPIEPPITTHHRCVAIIALSFLITVAESEQNVLATELLASFDSAFAIRCAREKWPGNDPVYPRLRTFISSVFATPLGVRHSFNSHRRINPTPPTPHRERAGASSAVRSSRSHQT